ncbi:MAG: twin-arginine translocase TatA/TatE family subunit [Candidatus Acidiferrales bacterium]
MLSVPHLIVIFVVALIVFGPEKLPELARNLGKVMAEFRRHTSDLRSTFEGHLRDLEREGEARRIGGVPSAPAASQPAVAAAPVAPAAGTVPSDPPNAAAIAPAAGGPPPEPFIPVLDPDVAAQDPYLAGAYKRPEPPPASEPESVPSPEPEKVSDGGTRPA